MVRGSLGDQAKLDVLLNCILQAATADPAVGVAVWVRLLLPQLLGLVELPSSTAKSAMAAAGKSAGLPAAGLADDLLRPLEVPLQGPAIDYLAQLLKQLQVSGFIPPVMCDILLCLFLSARTREVYVSYWALCTTVL